MHGAIPVKARKVVPVDDNRDAGFAVNSWTFTEGGIFTGTSHPYLNTLNPTTLLVQKHPIYGWYYDWKDTPEAIDGVGVSGQNVNNSPSLFKTHLLIAYVDENNNRKLYDPSYGTGPFSDFSARDDASIAALYKVVTSGNAVEWRFRQNVAGVADLKEE